jgi:hypothetical protein
LTVEVVNGRHKLILLLRSKTELVRLNWNCVNVRSKLE